jgi:hypothetical protein
MSVARIFGQTGNAATPGVVDVTGAGRAEVELLALGIDRVLRDIVGVVVGVVVGSFGVDDAVVAGATLGGVDDGPVNTAETFGSVAAEPSGAVAVLDAGELMPGNGPTGEMVRVEDGTSARVTAVPPSAREHPATATTTATAPTASRSITARCGIRIMDVRYVATGLLEWCLPITRRKYS